MSDVVTTPVQLKPGRLWRAVRTACVSLAWIALLSTPLIGGWQRADAKGLSAWRPADGFDVSVNLESFLGPAATGERVWSSDPLLGGGTGVEYVGVPMVDPTAGLAGATRAFPTGRGLWALLVPLLVGLLMGRVFCGWFCPFGSLSRLIRRVLERSPVRPPRFSLGERRWPRFFVLAACLLGGALGSQLLVTLALPHLVLTGAIYSLWLLGGGGALLGWLLGLIVAGVLLGPTAYCASVCPTGGLLSLLGRFRPVRLRIAQPSACGASCRQCDLACWLQLHPATGDAGADCDSCGRCVPTCPHDNLRVARGRGPLKRGLPVVTALLLALVPCASRAAEDPSVKPRLLLDAHRQQDGVDVAVGVLDESQVRLNADTDTTVGGTQLTVRLTRGPRAAPDALGRMGPRAHYAGPLRVVLERDGGPLETAHWQAPNSPRSTVRRKLYRAQLSHVARPGDVVIVEKVPGWTSAPVRFVIVRPEPGRDLGAFAWFFWAGLLVNAGLLSLALATGPRENASPPGPRGTPAGDPY